MDSHRIKFTPEQEAYVHFLLVAERQKVKQEFSEKIERLTAEIELAKAASSEPLNVEARVKQIQEDASKRIKQAEEWISEEIAKRLTLEEEIKRLQYDLGVK